ncbi:uncharacterized protein HMPREF1541_09128 [Cyphellophora europaea CBS 101466]|uniref:NmrA-like domain-containing protein n=1 Tax=Cyphellophora europaea (strain CBS 101466) TaxID=1220924 RepID=W2S9F0_CYPE1|nr:uncharacterized protein HMPREF1541_09128 [Cyphellophora europaea CBS 101466]ETN45297.1 hypothetical protein HMPREF1541_09128 [Cyphellophora europaea CBS 101466]
MASSKKIAVFPAAGKLGTSFYTHLSQIVSPERLILISRHPEKISKSLTDAGAEVRKADYDAPESLNDVFEGASYLFLISYPSIQIDHRFNAHRQAINAALKTSPGIEHIFYTSLGFGGDGNPESKAYVMQAHLKTEAFLKSLVASKPSLTFTSIREGIYSETYTMYTSFIDLTDPSDSIRIPHDGSGPGIAWVKIDELGEASAKLVKEFTEDPTSSQYKNRIVILTGPKDYSFREVASILSKIAGKQIRVEQVTEEEHSTNPAVVKVMGADQGTAAAWTTVFGAVRAGENSVVNGELERLLGREAEGFETTVRKSLAEGTWVRR